jgi:2-desacetyl-2-hydroxyethyl bacteriochlorophyllide A dehydrogenase
MLDKRTALIFAAPGSIRLEVKPLAAAGPAEVRVQTLLSSISAGTELLVYRGQFPTSLSVDPSIAALAGEFQYPLQYGYAAVGKVVEAGPEVDRSWLGRLVFAFHPHESAFLAQPGELVAVPEDIPPEDAIFFPNMETAVNLVMDGKPVLGEQVAVIGQGVVGLLTTALLAWFPLQALVTMDRYPLRRARSLELGAHASLDPADPAWAAALGKHLPGGADLVFELSGAPEALDIAIAAAGFSGRVVVGSWYGTKRAAIDLGGQFHRNRLQLVSSQVSTIAPDFSGRWTKLRRYDVAWEMIRRLRPGRLVTHTFPIERAAEAYQLLDQHPQETLQVTLTYTP